jgi:xanthosine phosphorylase
MKVVVIATITNFATGLSTTSHDHNEVVQTAKKASEKLNILVTKLIDTLE